MSDLPRGEGWWRASDGRYYPPELHPDYQPPAAPPPPPEPATSPDAGPTEPAPAGAPPPRPEPSAEPEPPVTPPGPAAPAGPGRAASPAVSARASATEGRSGSGAKVAGIVGAIVVALVAIGGLIWLLTDDDGEPTATTVTTPTSFEPAVTSAAPTTTPAPSTSTPAPTTDPTSTTGGGSGTPNDPFPIEGATFTAEESFGNTTWQGELAGLVEVDTADFNDEEGRCVLVLGVLTPTAIENGVITNGFDTPEIGAIDADGIAVESTVADCDTDEAEAAGYRWINDATVTKGTPFAFYDEFFFLDATELRIQAIQVGSDPQDGSYYEPTVIGEVPKPDLDHSSSTPPPSGDPMAGALFTYEEDFAGAAWNGEMIGMVEVATNELDDAPGRCYALLGVLTPTATEDGGVSDPFNTPNIGVVSRGRYIPAQFNDCEVTDVQRNGFGWILDAEVEVGTPYAFYAEVFVPRRQGMQSVVVGPPTGDGALFYQSIILEEVPEP